MKPVPRTEYLDLNPALLEMPDPMIWRDPWRTSRSPRVRVLVPARRFFGGETFRRKCSVTFFWYAHPRVRGRGCYEQKKAE